MPENTTNEGHPFLIAVSPRSDGQLLREMEAERQEEFDNAFKRGRSIVVRVSLVWLFLYSLLLPLVLMFIFDADDLGKALLIMLPTWLVAPAAGYGYVEAVRWGRMWGWELTKEKLMILAKYFPLVLLIAVVIAGASFALL
jgi:hypothetical protein